MELACNYGGFGTYRVLGHLQMSGHDLKAVNRAEKRSVCTMPGDTGCDRNGMLCLSLPPASWNVIRVKLEQK